MATLYEKRGRRYVPVADDRVWDHWPQGFHIVYVPYDGSRSTRFNINPDKAAFYAAIKKKENELRKEIDACFKFRPASRELTPAKAKAWKSLDDAIVEACMGAMLWAPNVKVSGLPQPDGD